MSKRMERALRKRGEYIEDLDGDDLLALCYDLLDEVGKLRGAISAEARATLADDARITIEGVEFVFSVSHQPDNGVPEVAVIISDYADKDVMVVAAFDEGGLTLCGDTVHLAVDGDEVFAETVAR